MQAVRISPSLSRAEQYSDLTSAFEGVLAGESDEIANLANAASLLFHGLPDLNWAGFYRLRDGELVLGPFQGRPACIRIGLGVGVCGTAAALRTTQIVPDVHAFPGHIVCDAASRSELVVPLLHADRCLGVVDLDSPTPARFTEEDAAGVEKLAALLVRALTRAAD